jgi:hypothetical protein
MLEQTVTAFKLKCNVLLSVGWCEQAEKVRKRKEKLQAHRFVTIKVATDDDIKAHVAAEAFDLVRLDALNPAHVLKVPKTATWGEVQAQLAVVTGVPPEKQCLRRWEPRANWTVRPTSILPVRSLQIKIADVGST